MKNIKSSNRDITILNRTENIDEAALICLEMDQFVPKLHVLRRHPTTGFCMTSTLFRDWQLGTDLYMTGIPSHSQTSTGRRQNAQLTKQSKQAYTYTNT